ncbi:MAG: glycosyltransferase family 39 protein [Solirubrobacterales bacterium]|nr:glycosyltransferase family 39 protein [Solirubrobacterales bacterium]
MAEGAFSLRTVVEPELLARPDERRPGIVARRVRLSAWIWVLAAIQVAVLVATSMRYGYHRDELYFIVAGSHPALGYPDQPPLVPLLSWAMHALAPSLVLLRGPSALVAGATTILAALIARELGGRTRAQIIAAACTASSAFALAVSHLVSTTTYDLLSTTLLGWLAIRAVVRSSGPSILAAGVVVGVGVEAKPQVGLVALVMVATLIGIGPRPLLRSRWAAGGALCAVVLGAPYLIWQQQHGWPQLTVAGNIAGSQEGGRAGFFPFQLVMVSPVLVPVWVAGLLAPFRRPGWQKLRFLPITFGAMAVLYFAGNGHAYYLASLYPVLLGLGASPTAEWTMRVPRRRWLMTSAIALSVAVSAVIALPLLPERNLQGSIVMALNPAQGETVGWTSFVHTVSNAWRQIPAAERPHTAIFTSNYAEAGAIELLGRTLRLPPAYSGHNGFSEWGKPPATDTRALLVGYNNAADARPYFEQCRALATINDGVGLNNQEQGLPVMLCRPSAPWPTLWPSLTHYN